MHHLSPRRVRPRGVKSFRSARSRLSVEALESRQLLTYSATLSGTSALFSGSGAGELLAFDVSGGLLRHNALTAPAGQTFDSEFDFDSTVPGVQSLAASNLSFVTVNTPTSTSVETITLGSPTSPAEDLLALFTIGNLGSGDSVLNIDNSGSTGSNTLTINSSNVIGSNVNVSFPALIKGGINISHGTGTNTDDVLDTFTGQPVNISGQGPLTVNVGNAGSAQNILAPLTITNSSNSTALNIVDTTNTANVNATIGATSITGLTPAAINYGAGQVTSLSIQGGIGDDIYQVNHAFDTTVLNPGGGNDSVSIKASGLPATGSFTTDGGVGFDTLSVDAGGAAVNVIPGSIQLAGRAAIDYASYESITIQNAANTPPDVSAYYFQSTVGTRAVDVTVATFTDADPNNTASTFTATVDWGDGTTTAGTVTQDASTPSIFYVTGSHLYRSKGNFSLSVTVLDHGTTSSTIVGGVPVTTSTTPVTVKSAAVSETVDDAPITATGVSIPATEGVALPTSTVVATFTTANPYALTGEFHAVIDWGDGTPTTLGVITATGVNPNGVTFSVTPFTAHTYTKDGTYTVTVTIGTDAGSAGIAHSLALVRDGSLDVTGATMDATAGTPVNATVATFVDNGGASPVDSYKIFINWGDGTTGPGTITGFNVGVGGVTTFTVGGKHTYTTPTASPITGSVTVTTDSGTVGQGTFTANVHGLNTDFNAITINEGQPLNNVTLATLSNNGGPPIDANYYYATADWGDGTPVTPVMINGSSEVIGSHMYREHGVYPVTITVGVSGNPNVLTFTRGITVNEVPIILNGHLDASSDSGISNSDGITNVVQPTFVGTSEPLSTVAIDAVPGAGGNIIRLGTATTDSSGAWIITSAVPLADGTYTINAHAVDRNNATKANTVLGNVTIDTVGPRVMNFLFNRPAGEVNVTLQDDRSGLAQQSIIDNAFYSITKPRLNNGTYLFTSLTASPSNGPTAPQMVTGVINNHLKLRGGVYTFTLTSGGVTDVAGNALDGEFYGYLPSGNGQRGGDFVAVIDTVHSRILSPKPMQGFGTPNVPPGALLPSYTIRPGRTITPQPPRFHLQGGVGNQHGLPPAQARLQAARPHRAFAGIFTQRHHKLG